MGKRGPAPTPTKVLQMRDSWRGNLNPREPKPEVGAPRCPAWLDRQAKATWKDVVPKLSAMGVLTKLDGNALARYCRLWSRWRNAEEFLRQNGTAYPVKNGKGKTIAVKMFPQVREAAQLAELLGRLEQQFGLTPAARSRIEAAPAQRPDDKRRFLNVGT